MRQAEGFCRSICGVRKDDINMLEKNELNIINKALAKGNDVTIKVKKNELIIIEQKQRIIGRTVKSDKSDS